MRNAALITGAAVRIGASMAMHLAEKGFDIAVHYNNSKKEALLLEENIKKLGVDCGLFQADFLNEDEISGLIPRVKKEFPNLNLLINNASVFTRKNISASDNDYFNSIFSINFKAPFILSRDFKVHLGNGNIINILDAKIKKSGFNYAAYLLTKKSLAEFTTLSAKEFAPGIRVNAIAPGAILPPKDGSIPKEEHPLKFEGTLDEINDALDFILENKKLAGEIIYIDNEKSS
jgi:pteridine reductase